MYQLRILLILLSAAWLPPLQAEAPSQGIHVTGRGAVSTAPDLARVQVGVVSRADSATQALQAQYVIKKAGKLSVAVHDVPLEIEEQVCRLKLRTMSIGPKQPAYLPGRDQRFRHRHVHGSKLG